MKKILVPAICFSLAFAPLAHADFKAECTNDKGKTSPCTIDSKEGNLVVTYASKANQHLNKMIPGMNITKLSGGEYSRRRVAESVAGAVLLSPLFLFALFSKKKLDNYGVEYKDAKGFPASFLIQTKKKYSMSIKGLLQSLSGQTVDYGAGQAEKK